MRKIYLTKDGLGKFQKEQSDLAEKRKEAVINISRAREMGDLSENGFYKAARHELSSIDRRIRELNYIIKYSEVIRNKSSKIVSLGSKVRVSIGAGEIEYLIVGKYEANPKEGKLSNESPVGFLLMGRKIGEKFILETDKKYNYKIISIS